jgi:hypothetical protein
MGEVLKLRRPRGETIKGAARKDLTGAMRAVGKCTGVVMVALGEDGKFALRHLNVGDENHDFDVYARAGAVIDKAKIRLLDED